MISASRTGALRRGALVVTLAVALVTLVSACGSTATPAPGGEAADDGYPGGVPPADQPPSSLEDYPGPRDTPAPPPPPDFYPAPVSDATPDEGLPEACADPEQGYEVFYAADDRYCLQYPASYVTVRMADVPGRRGVHFVPADASEDVTGTMTATLSVEPLGPVAPGSTPRGLADDYLGSVPTGATGVTFADATIGGEPAVIADGVPGRATQRVAFVLHRDRGYVIAVAPWGADAAADARTAAEALWDAVEQHFAFVDPQPIE